MKINRNAILSEMWAYHNEAGKPQPKEFIENHLIPCFNRLKNKRLVKSSYFSGYRQAAVHIYQIWYIRNRKRK